jgi:hypothetical protein
MDGRYLFISQRSIAEVFVSMQCPLLSTAGWIPLRVTAGPDGPLSQNRTVARASFLTIVGGAVLAILLSGCSTFDQAVGTYQTDLGRAPAQQQLESAVRTHLSSFGFQVRTQNPNNVETEWRTRSASGTVSGDGVQRVRDRARVQYRQRARSYYTASMRVEFEAFRNGRWSPFPVPEDVADEYEKIQERIQSELQNYMTQN